MARRIRWRRFGQTVAVSVVARFNGEEARESFDFRVPRPPSQAAPPPPPPPPMPPSRPVERIASEVRIPMFPWPAPDPSARDTVERAMLEHAGALQNLGDVDRVLSQALDATGYSSKSYFGVPHGFALATQIERIFPDGTPADVDRFDIASKAMLRFSLAEYLRALFTARPGSFRVIVFMVTDAVIAGSGISATEEEATAWLKAGAASLPASIRDLPFGPEMACTAMIYQFERGEGSTAEPRLRTPSPIPAEEHLQKAGILKVLQGGQ